MPMIRIKKEALIPGTSTAFLVSGPKGTSESENSSTDHEGMSSIRMEMQRMNAKNNASNGCNRSNNVIMPIK